MEAINLYLTRKINTGISCIGELVCEELGFNFATLEDPVREKKIKSLTAFQEGSYLLKWRKVLSPMTQRYQNKFDWFEWHIEIQDVPNYKNVYLHIGNYAKDSDGCVLIGKNSKKNMITASTDSFKIFYSKLKPYIDKVDEFEVWLHVDNCFIKDFRNE